MENFGTNKSENGSIYNNEKWLGIFLLCNASKKAMGGGPWNRALSAISQFLSGNIGAAIGTFYSNWNCCVHSAIFRIVSQKNWAENSIGTRCNRVFDNESNRIGFGNFISFAELMDPSKGFYNREKDKVTLTIDVTVNEQKLEKFILDQSKSEGTLFIEIEDLSEFEREIIGSERKSETVHIKGMPWKILAQINPKNESTDNEKWLGIYLLCDAPKEDEYWSCKCLSSFRIVSQKSGVSDYKIGEFTDEVTFNSFANNGGFSNCISFSELKDQSRGLYDKKEDKITLAIDVTVKEPKMEDKS